MHALAVDLGTTTLAASLINLTSGNRLVKVGSMNPQRSFGADVVSRLDHAVHSPDALREMSRIIRVELRRLAEELCGMAGIVWEEVGQIAIAGNPSMQHVLMGLPVDSLAFPPYRPLHTKGTWLKAEELEWQGDAKIYVFPMPGGFVGGDTVAFLYGDMNRGPGTRDQGPGTGKEGPGNAESQGLNSKALRAEKIFLSPVPGSPSLFLAGKEGLVKAGSQGLKAPRAEKIFQSPVPGSPSLFLDMGTNGEMALVDRDIIWATSAAAGPAFEGGNLTCGMAALHGAISSVRIMDERVKLTVIGAVPPLGICGSAALEAVAELLSLDIIEPTGRLRDAAEISSNLGGRVVLYQGENAFVLYRDANRLLLLTQGDIRQIQLAKSALRAGMEVLLQRACIRCEALEDVVLTGSFGAVLHPEWLKIIGIFDESMVHTTRFVPEGALTGVERAFAANDGFEAVEKLADQFRVVPLSGTPLFETLFLQHINFTST